ncbi:MAG: M20/M25/M40 family metallo-hydrolase, partial [Chloroflexota bacterium]|nr:M20/M25/M40 family metallo-hydrolase [Chloroflexota bacterium]
MDRAALRAAVWGRLEARESDLLRLCQQLVRIPSVNGVHPEEDIARAIAAALRGRGLHPQIHAFAPGRPTILTTLGEGDEGVLFIGHMDTVAAGDRDAWSVDPFSGTIRDGRLYGRGACDNKAGIAVAIILLDVLQEWAELLEGRVLLCCVPDEESGATGRIGIKPMLAEGRLKATQAIYTYPGLDLLSIGHRGLLRVRVRAWGEATHTGGQAWECGERGANAVTALAQLLLELERWQPTFEPHAAFPGRRPVVTPGTLFRGGEMESMVPPYAEAMIDVRLLPGQQADRLLERMQEISNEVAKGRPGIRFEWDKLVDLPAVSIPHDTPIVESLAWWTERLMGKSPTIAGAGPANEGYLLIEAGILTVCG